MPTITDRLKAFLNPVNVAQKSTWDIYNPYTSGLTYSGNNIADNKFGYAQAYLSVLAVRQAVDYYAISTQSIPTQIIRNTTGDTSDDEIIARSDDVIPHAIWYADVYDHRKTYGMNPTTAMMYNLILYDAVFVEKIKNVFRLLSGFRVLNSLGIDINYIGGEIHSFSYSWDTQSAIFKPDEIAYEHGFNPFDDLIGTSVLQSALAKVEIENNLDRFLRAFFRNNATIGIIGSPRSDSTGLNGTLNREQTETLKKIISDWHKGVANAFRPLILNTPVDLQSLPLPDVDKYSDVAKDIDTKILGAFGINPALVGSTDSTSYKDDLPQIEAQFINKRLKPVLSQIEALINIQILPFLTGNREYRFEFDYSDYQLITEQDTITLDMNTTQLQNSTLSINEYRLANGKSPIEGLDDYYIIDGVPVPLSEIPNLWQYKFGMQPAQPEQLPEDTINSLSSFKVPEKYQHINFTPTDSMVENAKRGLELRREFGRGGTQVGIARARDISNRRELSPDTVLRMYSYFSRHEVDKRDGWSNPNDPSNGYIAWLLWGGDEGYSWATARRNQMETADAQKSSFTIDHDHSHHAIDDTMTFDDYSKRFYTNPATLDNIFSELKTWLKYVKSDKHLKSAFVPEYTAGDIADEILQYNDTDAILDAINTQLDTVREWQKSIQSTRIDYEMQVEDLLFKALNNDIDKRNFRLGMMQAIRAYAVLAYIDGLRDGGVFSEPDDDERVEIERHIIAQRQYVNNLSDKIYDSGLTDNQTLNKPAMWYNKSISPMYDAGKASADKNGIYEWVYGATEHCKDCLKLNGQRHRMKTYYSKGILPQSDILECKGFNCKCNLVRVNARARGKLPNL